ncbi:LysR substrate-binding domain-containing protein [Qipengyuania gaetbuli]|uniref:LysR family transcriptional regulator n=1 Tax=Qipengyuania gaetbuli TaxID=266952 RepID=A0A844Y0A1_9SPHN|nr:LysR substrate-binding domain-containing protein [Qipengyuania gaetbuli]MCA0909051.1 LysR family transcriptional regulator [Qipengyuania gaetbuli]MXO50773.1 LysR family transcriptional regulator [Qipengyuania gaetbuli]
MKRTHLPLNALRVYDAAARHLSFTRAADELAVTPAAVGQQIRALEDHLGTVLFRRTSKGLELTQEGAAGLDALREGFLKFEESVSAMQAGQASDSYTIACPREFYAQWLAPRLAKFGEANPDIKFAFVADENADFTEANLDCAIRLVDGPGDLQGVELAAARRVTVAAPGAPDKWIDWGLPLQDGVQAHVTVSNAGQALSSAMAGLGKAILPELLAKEAIEAGQLEVLDGPEPGTRAYWLVAPTPQWRTKKVKALVAFLEGA